MRDYNIKSPYLKTLESLNRTSYKSRAKIEKSEKFKLFSLALIFPPPPRPPHSAPLSFPRSSGELNSNASEEPASLGYQLIDSDDVTIKILFLSVPITI